MNDMIGNLRRRAPRFQIKNSEALRVTVTKSDHSFEPIQTELVNISVGGAKFKSNQKVTVNEVVAVKIDVEHPDKSISVSGEVRWIAPLDGDEWWLGCAFKPPIPHEVLHEFARQGILERREHPRQRISLPVTAQWQLEYEPTTVTVVDYSAGGLCLISSTERGPGERVMLRFQLDDGRDVQIRATTRWEVQSDDGYLIGCEFVDPRDYLVISDLLESRELLESDLCDATTPRNVWQRLTKNNGPLRGHVRTAKRTLQPLREPASWIMVGGTMLFLLLLVISNQLRKLPEPSVDASKTLLTSSHEDLGIIQLESHREALNNNHAVKSTQEAELPQATLDTLDRLRSEMGSPATRGDLSPEGTDSSEKSPTDRSPASSPIILKSAVADVREGFRAYRRGNYDAAIEAYVDAASRDSTSPLIRYLLAAAQFESGQTSRAEHSLRRAIDLELDRPIDDLNRYSRRFQVETREWLESRRGN